MSLLEAVRQFILQTGSHKKYWVAYSGGLDSHVLLSLLVELRHDYPMLQLSAIHIHHGLNIAADAWALHCAKVCETYDVQYTERKLSLALSPGDSLEEVAREARYAAFLECMAPEDVLLTAHQEDDQAETVLLQLLRGAGLKGLSAMPFLKPFGGGNRFQARPLLHFSREVIRDYAVAKKLQWIEDDSNANTQHTRNFLRHEIMPLLKARWPSVTMALSRSAMHCAEAWDVLQAYIQDEFERMKGTRPDTLSVQKVLQLSEAKQKLLLRFFIQRSGFLIPDTKTIKLIQDTVLRARADRRPCVSWQGAVLRRYRDDLYLHRPETNISESEALIIPEKGILDVRQTGVLVRFRKKGEVVTLLGRGRHTLKHLFQEWGVPPWEREKIPLIFFEGVLVGVPGYFWEEKYTARLLSID